MAEKMKCPICGTINEAKKVSSFLDAKCTHCGTVLMTIKDLRQAAYKTQNKDFAEVTNRKARTKDYYDNLKKSYKEKHIKYGINAPVGKPFSSTKGTLLPTTMDELDNI